MIQKYFSKPYLFYLALLAFGISFGFTFQLANLSSVFKFLGATPDQLPFLWLAPPITGLIIQPLIGQMSDDTITQWGKRRPYIIGWGILAMAAFLSLPFFNSLLIVLFFTWIIGASLNGSTEALRALTTDLSQKKERSQAFALQAFLGGIGAALGTSLPYLMNKCCLYFHSSTLPNIGSIPSDLKFSFVMAGLVGGITVFISMLKVKEVPYKHQSLLEKKHKAKPLAIIQRTIKIFRDLGISIKKSSGQFRKYCFIHAAAWLGIFIFWLYFTTALAQNLYGLPPLAHLNTSSSHYAYILQKANLKASLYLSIYQYVSVAYALFLFFILNITEKTKFIHSLSLLIGGTAMALLGFADTQLMVVCCMLGIGVMWGSLSILPYTIVSHILPKGKFGVYLGIFNISITIPQIISGLSLSPIYIYLFKGHAMYMMLLAGLLIMLSGLLWLKEAYHSKEVSFAFKKLKDYFSGKAEIVAEKLSINKD